MLCEDNKHRNTPKNDIKSVFWNHKIVVIQHVHTAMGIIIPTVHMYSNESN